MKKTPTEVTPATLLADDLQFLKKTHREILRHYTARVEAELAHVLEIVLQKPDNKKIATAKTRDLRDMLTLVRMLDVKPEKGRRRDLKRVETLIEDLRKFVEDWQ